MARRTDGEYLWVFTVHLIVDLRGRYVDEEPAGLDASEATAARLVLARVQGVLNETAPLARFTIVVAMVGAAFRFADGLPKPLVLFHHFFDIIHLSMK